MEIDELATYVVIIPLFLGGGMKNSTSSTCFFTTETYYPSFSGT